MKEQHKKTLHRKIDKRNGGKKLLIIVMMNDNIKTTTKIKIEKLNSRINY